MKQFSAITFKTDTQRGIALLTVLWIVAIMSVIATGLISNVRTEVRTTSTDQDRIQAQALGQAAIYLALQQQPILSAQDPNLGTLELNVQFAQSSILVVLEPASQFLDINKVSAFTLERIFNSVGASSGAASLANRVIDTRELVGSGSSAGKFEAIEDLLQIPGITYDLFTAIEPLFTTMNQGSADATAGLVSSNIANLLGISSDGITISGTASTAYRARAQVTVGNFNFEMIQDIMTNVHSGMNNNTGLTWQILSTDLRVLPRRREIFS